MYKYIHIYIYIYLYKCIYIYTSIYIYISICVFVFYLQYIHVYIYIFIFHIYIYICIYIYIPCVCVHLFSQKKILCRCNMVQDFHVGRRCSPPTKTCLEYYDFATATHRSFLLIAILSILFYTSLLRSSELFKAFKAPGTGHCKLRRSYWQVQQLAEEAQAQAPSMQQSTFEDR